MNKYYTTDDDFNQIEIDQEIAKEVLRQYFERRFVSTIAIASFTIGFLLGLLAYAL